MSIPMAQHLTAVLISLGLILIVIQLIRKRHLREEYAFGWLGISLALLILCLFTLEYPLTILLSLGLIACMAILLHQSVILTNQADHIRDLAQNIAILEWRLRQYEKAQEETAVRPTGVGTPTPLITPITNGHTPKVNHHEPIN